MKNRLAALGRGVHFSRMADDDEPKASPGEARKAQLAAALRANLQRRKAQARARHAPPPLPPEPPLLPKDAAEDRDEEA